jgi:hypothetical protein
MITMKNIGVKVDVVRPCDRPSRGINCYLRKVGRLSQLVEETPIESTIKIELPDETIGEGKAETEVSQRLHLRNPG